ncbi:2'-5'-oligoadenylate synthase-like protein 2 [Talpa occidentalis]|uniref:2'-5'-oligoadenylate synthase-like protein 2 n=1 Tax=Talpa occidentalis TaxID=50954 RepID=UPI001890A76B|nr:2'-5'-oligoadenylate synthase-like protein 2 [Talpa occidentalis]
MEASQSLYETPSDSLDTFVEQSLQPKGDWKEEVQDAWQRICKFLRDHCFQDEPLLSSTRVIKIVKGGSSGKGTTLNHTSDVDLVLFLSCFSSFQNQALLRKVIIDLIELKLTQYSKTLAYSISIVHHREGKRDPRSLSFHVQAKKRSEAIKVDLLPAFDVLGNMCPDTLKKSPEIYENLINSYSHPGEFSPSFVVLQRRFVKSRPAKLKNLLRLVKHWYLQCLKPKYQKVALPSKYAMELLTIYSWEWGTSESENFNLDEGFIAVMKLLREYEAICIYWTKYYDFQNKVVRTFIKRQLKESRPVILDPADPTNNLGKTRGWDLVAKEAAHCLKQACCRTEDPTEGWHVQPARDVLVTVRQRGEKAHTLSVNPYQPIWKMKAELKKKYYCSGRQRLSFQERGEERQLLSSRKTLADYGIFSKVRVWMLETFPPEIQVFVKEASGRSKSYAVEPDDTIRDLKYKIEEAGGPLANSQTLKLPDRKVWNSSTLSDLQIKDCDTIMMFIKGDR